MDSEKLDLEIFLGHRKRHGPEKENKDKKQFFLIAELSD